MTFEYPFCIHEKERKQKVIEKCVVDIVNSVIAIHDDCFSSRSAHLVAVVHISYCIQSPYFLALQSNQSCTTILKPF